MVEIDQVNGTAAKKCPWEGSTSDVVETDNDGMGA